MPCRLKVQEQTTLESPGEITVFLVTLSTVWFKPSNCTIMTCLASYVMSPLRPSKPPPIKMCIQPYLKVKVLWTLAEVLLNLDHFTEQFRARLHQLLSTQSRAGSSLAAGKGIAVGQGSSREYKTTPWEWFLFSPSVCGAILASFWPFAKFTCAILIYFSFHAAKLIKLWSHQLLLKIVRKSYVMRKKYIKLVWHWGST